MHGNVIEYGSVEMRGKVVEMYVASADSDKGRVLRG